MWLNILFPMIHGKIHPILCMILKIFRRLHTYHAFKYLSQHHRKNFFFVKELFEKCEQICSFLLICSAFIKGSVLTYKEVFVLRFMMVHDGATIEIGYSRPMFHPAGIYLLKANNKTLEQGVIFEHTSHLPLVFLLLTLNMQLPTGCTFYSNCCRTL